MNKSARAKVFALACGLPLIVASAIHAKQPIEPVATITTQQEKPGEAKPAGQQAQPAPDTLQLLKGMPRPQIIQEMRNMAAALGVECNFCHVNPFGAETPRKSVARLMMRDYTMALKHKDGSALTCSDCHNKQPNPLRTTPFDGAIGKKLPDRQVLKGVPREKLMEAMTSFTKALGVECNFCHTSSFDEDTPRKQIARLMIAEYAQGLVKKDGSAVSCNDCHQGHARPLSILPFPRREQQRRPEAPADKKPNG